MADNGLTPARTVVLIGGRAQREFDVLRELGYQILNVDSRIPLHCMMWSDVPLDADVDDWEQVAKAVREQLDDQPPAAVLTHVEPRIPLMAYLSEQLLSEHRGLTVATALNCRDKWRTRSGLAEAGLPVPGFELVEDVASAVRAAEVIGFPVVVKPRDGAGAFGVRRCASGDEVRVAVQSLLDDPGPGSLAGVLVEEYIDGPEFAVQTLTRDGDTEILSVFSQHMTEPPVFVELSYEHPCGLDEARLAELKALMSSVLDVLGLRDWVSHTQVRLGSNGFSVVEVNARRPGGRLVDMTTAVSGVDMVEAVSRLALGLPPTVGEVRASHARYSSIVFEEAGTLLYNTPTADLDAIVELEVPSGEAVEAVDHPEGGVYGRIVVFGESPEELGRTERQIRDALALQVIASDDVAPSTADSREFKSCC
ncbi:acetyl-CoA carboxylase biotin carboxylase subunit family protein [Kutzneria sp. 744]|uniref:ATP-grasp domain-containing protein n=1 Tax=Kutzneria sp. (strain 744) TaxID=345341 RepID=UPI0003EEC858|nr:ATP-grasp domain-containing protein [Kutzneria sp. 744]EWM19024.1 LigA protein [Kutzneria sp. 744]